MSETVSTHITRRGRAKLGAGLGLALGAALLIGGGVALAQDRFGGHGWGGGPRHGGMARAERIERFCANDTARYGGAIRAFAKADLRLDQRQSAELDKFADVLLPGLQELKATFCDNAATMGQVPPPERMAKLAATLRKAAELAEKSVEPSKQFYATLDEAQKKRVDEWAERRRGR